MAVTTGLLAVCHLLHGVYHILFRMYRAAGKRDFRSRLGSTSGGALSEARLRGCTPLNGASQNPLSFVGVANLATRAAQPL